MQSAPRLAFERLRGAGPVIAAGALLVQAGTATAQTTFPPPLSRPAVEGDQVVFFYDVRSGFTTFFSLRNAGASDLTIRISFYGAGVDTPFVHTVIIPVGPGSAGEAGVGGAVVVDVRGLVAAGLPEEAGIAMATVVDDADRSIVTRFLSGSFTVANLATNAAWGGQGLARSAVLEAAPDPNEVCPTGAPRPSRGAVIDGTTTALQAIQPRSAELTVFFDPASLAPVADGGNQLIFVSFEDEPGSVYSARAAATTWEVTGVRQSGVPLTPTSLTVEGVVVSDLVTVVGDDALGASGSLTFETDDTASPQLTRLIFFTQALGTFGTGYLLPR